MKSAAIQSDAWLSEVMSRPAFRVSRPDNELVAHAKEHPRAFYYAKVSTADIPSVHALAQLGFFSCDVNVTLELAHQTATLPSLEVRNAAANDHHGVLEIAGSAFDRTRFHLDPYVGLETAHAIKREWMRSYCTGKRGDRLFVVHHEGEVAGFLGALTTADAAVIDLIAVSRRHHRLGIGRALTLAFIREYFGRRPKLIVGTQAANTPSIRMYESVGFRFSKSEYVLHKHVDT